MLDQHDSLPNSELALCLSGGGYRAMLFHLGAIWRLAQLGYLCKLRLVSSVSGGSITAGMLAMKWHQLAPHGPDCVADYVTEVVDPIRSLALRSIDLRAVLLRYVWFPREVALHISNYLDKYLYKGARLGQLPATPRFVFNATSVQTGEQWRFSRDSMGDSKVGLVLEPTTHLTIAVTASAAFPPVLSPLTLRVNPGAFTPGSGVMQAPPFNQRIVLTDGGLYDNLGLDPAFDSDATLLVSDGGAMMDAVGHPGARWLTQTARTIEILDNQVRSLTRRRLEASLLSGERMGAWWGIRSHFQTDRRAGQILSCPPERTAALAAIPTRLARVDQLSQERLINWGFAACDGALRQSLVKDLPEAARFPYSNSGV